MRRSKKAGKLEELKGKSLTQECDEGWGRRMSPEKKEKLYKNPIEALKKSFWRSNGESEEMERKPTWGQSIFRESGQRFFFLVLFLPICKTEVLITMAGKPLLYPTRIVEIETSTWLKALDFDMWCNLNRAMQCHFEIAACWLTLDIKICKIYLKATAIRPRGTTRLAEEDWSDRQSFKELMHSPFKHCANNFLLWWSKR